MATEEPKSAETSDKKRQSLAKQRLFDNTLPMARIKKIMKMAPNIQDNISNEATFLVCTATEQFVRWIAKEAYDLDTKALSYQTLARYVQDEDKLDFLHPIIPHKITVRDFKKILAEEKKVVFDSASDASSDSEEEEEEEEENSGSKEK